MVYINEWFPNPIGNDANGEFVELFNNGSTGVSLNGWTLWSGGKSKKASLDGVYILPGGYLVLKKPQTKLSLKNIRGGLWLYGPGGIEMDHGQFTGAAPEGKSFSRADYEISAAQHFAFTDPTPGRENNFIDTRVFRERHSMNVRLNPQLNFPQVISLMFGTALVVTSFLAWIIYKNEIIANFIFKRNHGTR